MWREHFQAGLQRERETIAPAAARHRGGGAGEVRRQFFIQRDDDRLLAWEVSIQQSHADAGLLGHIAERRRCVAPLRHLPDRNAIEALPRRGALRRLARGTAPATLDIFGEHVY